MKSTTLMLCALTVIGLSACSDSTTETETTTVASPGQTIWQANCAVCHQQGLGGAPVIGNQIQWKKRVEQGLPTLISHALNGYSGETGEMPPRGGNAQLTDQEVELAVTYMVSKVQ